VTLVKIIATGYTDVVLFLLFYAPYFNAEFTEGTVTFLVSSRGTNREDRGKVAILTYVGFRVLT
jgi:hypothetical protein